MTIKITARQAKATFSSVLQADAGGEDVEITEEGRTVARIVPASGSSLARRASLSGIARTAGNDEELFATGQSWRPG